MAKVLIADQSCIISEGLTNLINSFNDIEWVRVVSIAEDCSEEVEKHEPDLILINTSFLSNEQVNRLNEVKKEKAIVLHVFNTVLPFDAPESQLSILDSKTVLSQKLATAINKLKIIAKETEAEELSPREKAILKQVALGYTNKEIAEKSFISTHTVISHRKNITRKLGIKTVSGLTVYAILNNIIQMEDIS
jgi:DNA-binding NarL/FixJ family response regulator